MKRVEFNYKELCKATQRFMKLKEDAESPVSASDIYRYLSASRELGGLSLNVSRSKIFRLIRLRRLTTWRMTIGNITY